MYTPIIIWQGDWIPREPFWGTPTKVPLTEAQALASVVAFSGGSVIFSDDVTTLEKATGGSRMVAAGHGE